MQALKTSEGVDYKDIAVRASKTFFQAFVAAMLVSSEPLSKKTLLAAGAMAISATWNFLKATW
jgi:hypothetical protein